MPLPPPPPPPPIVVELLLHAGSISSDMVTTTSRNKAESLALREPNALPSNAIPPIGSIVAKRIRVPGLNRLALEAPLVAIVNVEVCAVVPGVTDPLVKWQTAFVGRLPHDSVTAWPKLEFTDDTVTVIADVVCPLATETVAGDADTEKSAGAAPIFATKPSAKPPP